MCLQHCFRWRCLSWRLVGPRASQLSPQRPSSRAVAAQIFGRRLDLRIAVPDRSLAFVESARRSHARPVPREAAEFPQEATEGLGRSWHVGLGARPGPLTAASLQGMPNFEQQSSRILDLTSFSECRDTATCSTSASDISRCSIPGGACQPTSRSRYGTARLASRLERGPAPAIQCRDFGD